MGVTVDLGGRRVLVTGASSGIGAATCRSVVEHGGAVAMLARRKERLDALQDELGARSVAVPCDVTDFAALETAVDEAARALGGLDGVIAVAGKSMVGTIATGTPQRWRELIELNLVGPLATVRSAIGHFPDAGRRDVVLVGSTGAITPMPGAGIYAASKRGLRAAFDALRLELAPAGVNVSYVMPGMFDTEGLTVEGLVFDGDPPPDYVPWFAEGGVPASAKDLADVIAMVIGLPDGLCINELVVRPTRQLNP
jgi:NADP-dependent 3-hydroxy acid dehydrogenase YdfG